MSSLRGVPEGTIVARTYYSIPGHYGSGDEFFPTTGTGWSDAVRAARAKKAHLVESLTESLGRYSTAEGVEEIAGRQVRIDLRWALRYPDGGGLDTPVESYTNIDALRTREEVGA